MLSVLPLKKLRWIAIFFRVRFPEEDWSVCDFQCQRVTVSDNIGQNVTQLVRARWSFVCQQNCTRHLLSLIA